MLLTQYIHRIIFKGGNIHLTSNFTKLFLLLEFLQMLMQYFHTFQLGPTEAIHNRITTFLTKNFPLTHQPPARAKQRCILHLIHFYVLLINEFFASLCILFCFFAFMSSLVYLEKLQTRVQSCNSITLFVETQIWSSKKNSQTYLFAAD